MKYKSARYTVLFLLLITFVYRCAPPPCSSETNSTVKAYFYKTGTGTSITADSVTLYGIGRDTSKIYDKTPGLKSINFPLFAESDSCSFFVKLNKLTDTVTFYYSSYTHLISKECGYTFFHTLDSVKHNNSILDYQIRNNSITTFNEENIRIFY